MYPEVIPGGVMYVAVSAQQAINKTYDALEAKCIKQGTEALTWPEWCLYNYILPAATVSLNNGTLLIDETVLREAIMKNHHDEGEQAWEAAADEAFGTAKQLFIPLT